MSCIQPDLQFGEAVGRRVLQTDRSQSTVSLDGFMTRGSFDAFGSGSYASRTVLALMGQPWSYLRLEAYSFIWVMRGGIGCIWRLGAERQHAGPSSLIDTLPRPRASQEPIG